MANVSVIPPETRNFEIDHGAFRPASGSAPDLANVQVQILFTFPGVHMHHNLGLINRIFLSIVMSLHTHKQILLTSGTLLQDCDLPDFPPSD